MTEPAQPYAKDRAFWGMVSTQFLGAFNDNLFKQLVLLMCTAYVIKTQATGDIWQSIAQAAFALPFVLFSGYGGYLSDRFSKQTIVVRCKVAEIVVMGCGTAVLFLLPADSSTGVIAMCGVLFLMGMQSAFFGPAKYGILPEMLRERDLPLANGFIQMTTFLAIIFGMVAAGNAKDAFPDSPWMVPLICVGIAVAGTLTSLLVRKTPVAKPGLELSRDALWINRDLRDLLRKDPLLLRVLLITTLFWFLGGAVIPAVNNFGEINLKLGGARTSMMAAMMGVGIAIGCPTAGIVSGGTIRFGMVRLGALGMCISACTIGVVPFLGASVASVEMVSRAALAGLGFFGGLFAVPLQVFLQTRPPKEQKGRMIGSMNLVNWLGILVAAGYHAVSSLAFGAGNSITFIILGAMILPVAVFLRPQPDSSVEHTDRA